MSKEKEERVYAAHERMTQVDRILENLSGFDDCLLRELRLLLYVGSRGDLLESVVDYYEKIRESDRFDFEGGLRMKKIFEEVGISLSPAGRYNVGKRLEKMGLFTRFKPDYITRGVYYELTDRGKALYNAVLDNTEAK